MLRGDGARQEILALLSTQWDNQIRRSKNIIYCVLTYFY
jgi:hypothetical protein